MADVAYFMLNNVEAYKYVNKLEIKYATNYTAQTNAAGDTVVDYINRKRKIVVGIIPIDAVVAEQILAEVAKFEVSLTFVNPETGRLEQNVKCIIPDSAISYYYIGDGRIGSKNTMLNGYTLEFTEL